MVMLLESGCEIIDDAKKLITAEVLLSRTFSILAEHLEASFHRMMLSNVRIHETWYTSSLLDFWKENMFLADLMVVNEVKGNAAVVEEVSGLLCSRNDMGCLLVDRIEGTEEGIVSHGHDPGILDAVMIVRKFAHRGRTSV